MPSLLPVRPLLRALTGLLFSISGLLGLTLILLAVDGSQPDATPAVTSRSTPPAIPSVPGIRPAGYESGKTLFTNNCAQCHALTAEVIIGPGLLGVYRRVPGDTWLRNWIRNSSAVIAGGDPYAGGLYAKFNKVQMTSFGQFSDQNIRDLLTYIDAAGASE